MSEIQDLFKVPLYFKELELDNKAMAKYCLSMSKKDKGRELSNIGGWQSNDLNGVHKPLNGLLEDIEYHSNQFASLIDIKGPLTMANVWININGYKDINEYHLHSNCLLSGVYYIQTPKDCGNINFYHPSHDTFQYDWNNLAINHNNYNSAVWWLPSKAGKLYIFPSWLYHNVKPNLNKKEKRISISFNIK